MVKVAVKVAVKVVVIVVVMVLEMVVVKVAVMVAVKVVVVVLAMVLLIAGGWLSGMVVDLILETRILDIVRFSFGSFSLLPPGFPRFLVPVPFPCILLWSPCLSR